ncbi:hypothetical protein QQ008_23855 [Fulvivirgaceae bacterium BMA10]|uniref:Uncharacterized protein n=1 Tax=Splendidivirga corallicola TaxID=3051826 RepID=A0ABT8KWA7_9BACT|nr:hypothetical protein [Fulvivirgaceae bacterium BMA10]
MLAEIIVGEGANTFIWIVVLLLAFVASLTFVDQLKGKRNEK